MDYEKQNQNRFLPIPENEEDSQSSKSSLLGLNKRKHTIVRKQRYGKGKIFTAVFETNHTNTFCVNAKTNQQYNVRFGAREERGLFSVILATGETGQTPLILFYDNPEQYERHFNLLLNPETKKTWYKKKGRPLP
jgi:hypothetical protein